MAESSRRFTLGVLLSAFILFGACALPLSVAAKTDASPSFFQGITTWLFGLFDGKQDAAPTSQAAAAASIDAGPAFESPTPEGNATTTIVNQYITNPVIERIIEQAMPIALTGVSRSELDDRLQQLDNKLSARMALLSAALGNNSYVSTQTFAQSQRIDNLSGVTISNASIDGLIGLTDTDIPDDITASSYLPLTGGTISGTLSVGTLNASSTSYDGLVVTNATTTSFFATVASSTSLFATTGAFGNISVNNVTARGTIDASSSAGGYLLDGHPFLNASSTNFSIILGFGNSPNGGTAQSLTASGIRNVVFGYNAMANATDAVRNVAIGYGAGASVIAANDNVFVGYNTGSNCRHCSFSTALGFQALTLQTGTSSVEHAEDDLLVAVGAFAMGNTTYQRYGTAVGVQALQNSATSTYDTAIGYQAMNNFNTSGTSAGLNTAIGAKSMRTAGSGAENTAVGWLSQQSVTGSYNTCVGSTCLGDLTTGVYNTALGYFAGTSQGGSNPSGFSVTTGTSSIFIGDYAGLTASASTTQLQYSAAIGSHATVGANNSIVLGGTGQYYAKVGIGTTSPYARLSVQVNSTDNVVTPMLLALANDTGSGSLSRFTVDNSGNGIFAGTLTLGGSLTVGGGGSINIDQNGSIKQNSVSVFYASSTKSSVFAGETAGIGTFTGIDNTAFGHAALDRLTTGGANTAVGIRAGFLLSTGGSNVAIGNRSLAAATSTSETVAVGSGALFSVSNAAGGTSGTANTAVGFAALNLSTSGSENTAVGYQAMGLADATGSRNAAVGWGALRLNTSGIRNAAFGYGALGAVNTGGNNVGIGFSAGGNITSGSGNIVIGGLGISAPISTGSNQLNIGNLIFGTALSGTGVTVSPGNIGIGTSTPYAKLSVWGTDTASTTIFSAINSASTTVFAVYGSGNATYAGSIFQSSDQRLKTDITELDEQDSLAALNALVPVSYRRIDQPDTGTNLGFVAQALNNVFPSLVTVTAATALTPDGTYTVNYAGLIAPIVRSIQALSNKIDDFAEEFTTNDLTFVRATGDEIQVQKLCIGETCVDEAQLQALLAGAGASGGAPSDEEDEPVPDTEAPIITINGANPAHLSIGDIYSDMGATVSDNVDANLGHSTYLDGVLVSQVSIDTSATASYTIEYAAIDNAGNTATSTRTVIVEAP